MLWVLMLLTGLLSSRCYILRVILGLDPRIHLKIHSIIQSRILALCLGWILGSSPRMTKRVNKQTITHPSSQ